ncbi:MAG: nucleotidyltransferase domain-containing protein [Nitrospira sp.]|nr:nucleotidyltransferase domain-containing protein [Nitrospira sp.]
MKEATKTYLSYNEQKVLEGIIQRIPSMYPMINKILLYGSKVRGDFLEESDIDILFVTDYTIPRAIKFEIYDIIFELEVEYNVVISAIFVNENDFNTRDISFINQVYKEGAMLWSRE